MDVVHLVNKQKSLKKIRSQSLICQLTYEHDFIHLNLYFLNESIKKNTMDCLMKLHTGGGWNSLLTQHDDLWFAEAPSIVEIPLKEGLHDEPDRQLEEAGSRAQRVTQPICSSKKEHCINAA
jgi:hypothetical protein